MSNPTISPRFVFLGQQLESVQTGPDRYADAYPSAENPTFRAGETTGLVVIEPPGGKGSYVSSLPWPTSGSSPGEIGSAVLDVLRMVDRYEDKNVLRELGKEIEDFLDA